MGHESMHVFLKAKDKEDALQEACRLAEEFANAEGDEGYHYNIRYYNKTFNTEEDAISFFESLDSYDDGVCKVKEASRSAQEKYAKLWFTVEKKQQELRDKAIEKFKERTSKTIGCKKCGTRIKSEEALKRRLYCPNCRNWLVSDSYKARYDKLEEKLEVAKKQLQTEASENGKERFWAKFEIHT